jgi:hypothetical protein
MATDFARRIPCAQLPGPVNLAQRTGAADPAPDAAEANAIVARRGQFPG